MNGDPQRWQRFADASRHAGAAGRTSRDSREAGTISWLPHLPERVHATFLQVIWKRWVLAVVLASLVVLGALLLVKDSKEPAGAAAPGTPKIPIPAAP